MRLLPRTTTCNPVAVAENGGEPYSTGYYETSINRTSCCGSDPDLYSTTKTAMLIKTAFYIFKCEECGKEGGEAVTPNSAAGGWNTVN